ncbi:MAG TPA: Na+/H+ antiporter NhaA [Actinomycetes bacterium]|jgi:NhaA family Na+:H+ antiporter|nr:Na+/H+ antiporter NhaA [Actinomycetes bacterium]
MPAVGDRKPLVPPPLRLPTPLREYLREEAAGGAVLMVAAALALAWANSPWRGAYADLWETRLAFQLGRFAIEADLRRWVDDGLMTLFFLVVGLEIKRELVAGELRTWRMATLPVVAAAGGMAVPAAIYAAVNAGEPGAAGWGVPMATDIAFALGVLALLGSRVPAALKVFLLTLAVVDDLGSIAVVALFYSRGVDLGALAAAVGLLALVAVLVRARIWWLPLHVGLGLVLWLIMWHTGVSPALAGVAMGMLTPARPTQDWMVARDRGGVLADELAADPHPPRLREMLREARGTVSLAERLAHDLHPLSAFVVVPLFALANAGVSLDRGGLAAPGAGAVLGGVLAGRVLGKLAGISAAAWLAIRLGLAVRPAATSWAQLAGVATVAGIGFTVPLFVADLAFPDGGFQAPVKLGLLLASVAAGAAGALVLLLAGRDGTPTAPGSPDR